MSKSEHSPKVLPSNPSAEFLRKAAKRLARKESVRLATAQRRLAHEYGYRNWAELMAEVRLGAKARQPEALPSATSQAANVLPLLPLRELIAFPRVVHPVFIGRPASIRAVRSAWERKVPIVMAAQKDASVANPGIDDIYPIGVLGVLVRVESMTDGTLKALIEGKGRVRISRFLLDAEQFGAQVEAIGEQPSAEAGVEHLLELVASAFVSARFKSLAGNRSIYLTANSNASVIADRIASHLQIGIERKQELLETTSTDERLRKILAILNAAA